MKKTNKNLKRQLEKSPHWERIKKIILKISQRGHTVVVAGGAVRDTLLKKAPKDIDLAVSAKPQELLKIWPSAKGAFAKYGVVFIPLKSKETLEITTFRKDSSYKDGRRPSSISYSTMKEDALRRDFTINALFYDSQKEQLIDEVSGLKDLKNKKIRAVGKPKKRFEEDHLRILRALRLAHQLNFQIEKETQQAIVSLAGKLKAISKERILSELNKMFSKGQIGTALKSLKKQKVWGSVFPDLKPTFKQTSIRFWNSTFSFLEDKAFVWAVFCLPFFKFKTEEAKAFLKSRPIASADIKKSLSYIKAVQSLTHKTSSLTEKLLALNKQKEPVFELSYFWKKSLALETQSLKKTLKEFEKKAVKGLLPPPLVKGTDLLKLSPAPPKAQFSFLLKQAFEHQIEKPKSTKKDILRQIRKTKLK